MEEKERIRLNKLYEQYSDDALIDMALEDESAYQEGVYELILEEVKKRGLEKRIDEIKKDKIEKESRPSEDVGDLVTVYAGTQLEVQLLKNLLEAEGIAAFLKDEIIGTILPPYASAGGAGAIKVTIPERDLMRAQPIIHEFLKKEE